MLFEQALRHLREGSRISCDAQLEGFYWVLEGENLLAGYKDYPVMVLTSSLPIASTWFLKEWSLTP